MTISLSNLGKRFNRDWIFKGLTTEFITGNTYAITGPNGSGKSTLLQVLWGQMPATEGTIDYKIDNSPKPPDDIFSNICIATPYMDLIEEFSLTEQIDFHLRFKTAVNGLSTADLIQKMQLEHAASKPIKQFSSGMKQRLKLGLAIFFECEVLFLDEPSTNLDKKSNDWYFENLMEIHGTKLILIATNQSSDFPVGSKTINLTTLKTVTNQQYGGIQPS